MAERVCVIVNPAAGRGRGARALPLVREAFAAVGITDIRVTASKADERTIASRAITEGATTVVAVGGDGTWSNVANAVLSAGAADTVRLGLIAAGTGNDFAKTVDTPASDYAATARLVADGVDTRVDVGHIEDQYFLNIAGFGFDVAVLEDIPSIPWLKGDAVYIYSALRQLVGYGGVDIDISTAAGRRGPTRHLMLIIANAKHFGGAFRIAPHASLTDGALDAISILDATTMRRLKLFGAAARGTHIGHNEVVTEAASAFTIHFAAPPAYETDGEYRQASSADVEVRCLPGALRVVAPPAQR